MPSTFKHHGILGWAVGWANALRAFPPICGDRCSECRYAAKPSVLSDIVAGLCGGEPGMLKNHVIMSWAVAGQVCCGHSLLALVIGTLHAAMWQNLSYFPVIGIPVLHAMRLYALFVLASTAG